MAWRRTRAIPFKAERVAMEEVRRGLVLYEVPAAPGRQTNGQNRNLDRRSGPVNSG